MPERSTSSAPDAASVGRAGVVAPVGRRAVVSVPGEVTSIPTRSRASEPGSASYRQVAELPPMVKLPAQALTQLAEIRAGLVAPGEIFWLPTSLIMFYDSDRDERPCLVVGVDRARAHLVPGTTKRRGGCCVVVQPGETGLPKRTYFDFSFSFSLALLNLVNSCHPKVLDVGRWPDVVAAVDSSQQVALKRVVPR